MMSFDFARLHNAIRWQLEPCPGCSLAANIVSQCGLNFPQKCYEINSRNDVLSLTL